jgi:hypothetical protein
MKFRCSIPKPGYAPRHYRPANNSFNGNYDTFKISNIIYGRAQGPQSQSGATAYSLNNEIGTFGDDLTWSFFINKDLDLTPRQLTQSA